MFTLGLCHSSPVLELRFGPTGLLSMGPKDQEAHKDLDPSNGLLPHVPFGVSRNNLNKCLLVGTQDDSTQNG